MPDVRTLDARSFTFIDDWNGVGRFSFALTDGSCVYIKVTAGQAALANAQLSEFVAREMAKK